MVLVASLEKYALEQGELGFQAFAEGLAAPARLWIILILPGPLSHAAERVLKAPQPEARRSVGSVGLSLSVQVPGSGLNGATNGVMSSKMADEMDLGEKMVCQ